MFFHSSVPLPKDAGHFQRERKIALTKALQVQYKKTFSSVDPTFTILSKNQWHFFPVSANS